jgi:hypothetical protein
MATFRWYVIIARVARAQLKRMPLMSSPRFVCVLALILCTSAGAGQVALKSATIEIAQSTPLNAASVLKSLTRTSARHAIVQFDSAVDANVRARLAAAGVELQGYLGEHVFFAGLQAGVNAAALAQIQSLAGAEAIQPDWKIHPMLAGGAAPDHALVGKDAQGQAMVAAYLLFHTDVNGEEAMNAALPQHGVVVRDVLESINGAVIELPINNIAALAAEDVVQWIEPALPRMSTTNAENRVLTQANLAQAAPYNLNGAGVNVLVYDGGTARATHVDFSGRLFVRDSSGQITHATHVSGTIGGDGTANANNRGMAPAVTIQSYGFEHDGSAIFLYSNPGDIEADYGQAITQFGAVIANNSIGSNTETNGFPCAIQGDYGVTDVLIDSIVRGSVSNGQPFRIVWANGNERQGSSCDIEGFGDYYSIAPPAGAKNHITAGATNANDDSMTSFSSWGPTDDGRMKPDISAPGCQSGGDGGVTSCSGSSNTGYTSLCGTSMASPTVTGCCSLLLQDFRNQFAGLPDPRNSTLKVLLAHNAQDRGNPGPDYQFGYGSVRIKDTIDFMRTGGFVEAETGHGAFVDYNVTVAPGTPVLKATLAWDDPPASPLAGSALVNDLDVVAIAPGGGTTHLAWTLNPLNPAANAVQTAPNRRDNLEQVFVTSPAAGTWTIRVSGFNVPQGPQKFSLAANGLQPAPGVFISLPNGTPATMVPGVAVNVNVRVAVFGDTLVANSPTLHVRYDGGTFNTIPLTFVSGIDYTATLPPPTCSAAPQFYFSAAGANLGVVTNPSTAPASVYEAEVGQTVTLANETFEGAANGWIGGAPGDTATTGVWVQVDPVGTNAQPEDDHTAAPGVKGWVTGQGNVGGGDGDNDVDGGFTTLRSALFDLTGSLDPVIGYWRWYDNSSGGGPNGDTFVIDVSNNGANWINVETVGPGGAGTSGGWIFHQFNVASLVTPNNQVRLRFIASDTGTASLVEAGIDDLAISSFQCTALLDDCNGNGIEDSGDIAAGLSEDANSNGVPDECEGPICAPDINGDDQVNVTDLIAVITAWGPCAGCPADVNDDGQVNVADLLVVITAWGPCP